MLFQISTNGVNALNTVNFANTLNLYYNLYFSYRCTLYLYCSFSIRRFWHAAHGCVAPYVDIIRGK